MSVGALSSNKRTLLNPPAIVKTHNAIISIIAAATDTTAYQLSPRAGRFVVTKIMAFNDNAAETRITLGELVAAVFTPRLPDIVVMGDLDASLTENEIPAFEFTTDLIVRASVAAAAPANVLLMIEVKEW